MLRATDMAQLLLRHRLKPGDVVVDATLGNGHDTLFLANQVGPSGRVIGFDVQKIALTQTEALLEGRAQVQLVHAGHERLGDFLDDDGPPLAACMFNLGYLPGRARTIMTRSGTTLDALQQVLTRLKIGGLVTIVLYPGHEGGAQEAADVLAFVQSLGDEFAVSRYHRINSRRPAPDLLVVDRKG